MPYAGECCVKVAAAVIWIFGSLLRLATPRNAAPTPRQRRANVARMSIEVRQCSQCQAAAAVCIRDWAITTYGIPSGKSTRDFCCQQCGHQFTLVSQHQILAYGVLSAIFLVACVGIIPGAYTAYLVSLWVRNPVVPNAPPPVMRFRGSALPLRLCTKCQGSARCTDVVRRRSGTTYTYVCMTCSKSFDIESVGSIFFLALAATIVTLIGLATLMGGVGVICLLMALFGYVSAALGIWRLFANKVLPEQAP